MSVFRYIQIWIGICLLSCVDASTLSKFTPRQSNSTSAENVLRIQPLGNSITYGYLSTDGNGYRLGLLDMLTAAGNTVQYVGSVQSGNMTDNYNEGHPGAVISEIAAYANLSLPEDPNVVLLMAGTNDMNDLLNITTAPERLSGLIDEITNAVPNVTVIVSQLTPAANTTVESAIETFNAKIPDIVSSKVAAGKKVSVINMMDYVTVADLQDGLHPTDYGYQQMAKAYFAAIQKVQSLGWIDSPIATNVTSAVTLTQQAALATSTSSISSTASATTTSSITAPTTTGTKSSSGPRCGVNGRGLTALLVMVGSYLLYA